tara:strand:+ start:90404 stop:90970 length:567 start_codon:yes stop_codon:yes gene_type:complete
MHETIIEMLIMADYLCGFNDLISYKSSQSDIKRAMFKALKNKKCPDQSPEIIKLIHNYNVDFSLTQVAKSDLNYNGQCVFCSNSYKKSEKLLYHILSKHTLHLNKNEGIDAGEFYSFLIRLALSHKIEGMLCEDYEEFILFSLRKFKREVAGDISDTKVNLIMEEIIESEDFYSRGIRVPGSAHSNFK